jgi:hypothetical protein
MIKRLVWMFLKPYYKIVRPTFQFKGENYSYFWAGYNMTWRGERCVEIPIARRVLLENKGKKILEIGNVLGHYFPVQYDVVDKYEKAPGVMNEDILQFKPRGEAYDLILSISTMEHVGWDETPREPEKIFAAFENIKRNCLAPGGQLVVTMPLGYNSALDEGLANGRIEFSENFFMKRLKKVNDWKETDYAQVRDSKYMDPYPFANGLFVGIFKK